LRTYQPAWTAFVSINQGNRNKRPRALGEPSLQLKVPKGSGEIEDASVFSEDLDAFADEVMRRVGS
jgi:hypothetical protein